MSVGGQDNGARLEAIQGGVNLINERLKHANELQNERHAAICKDIDNIKNDHSSLDGRVVVLERRDSILVGERQGIGIAAKVVPWLGGGGIVAIIAAIARAFAV